MPLSWNEIRDRAIAFSREWKDETSEDAEAKTFWDDFFHVFGITRRRVASFEKPAIKSDGKGGFIDLLWKGVLLVEHKSRGRDLDRAFHQATDYFHGLKERDLPRYVVVSDFARIRLYDLDSDEDPIEFPLKELHKNIRLFGFIAGYQTKSYPPQDQANIEAAEKLGKLHDLLRDAGYEGHPLELFLVRILFCLFAEDNAIFERQQFREWIEQRTAEDGSDLGPLLAQLFQVLNTPEDHRQRNLDEHLAAFRYINGKLFEESIPLASLDRRMREVILECSGLDWSRISPAIFGALFQSIKDKKARRNLGEHYTSETNILKALQPLFLDSLRAEFERVRRDSKRLGDFHAKLRTIRVLDPACGCGNFLVIAYRELRLLELDVLREIFKHTLEGQLTVSTIVFVDVDQFYGIEIEEFPAQIAQVALWMTDHQMNQLVSAEFGQYFARLPLKKAPNIVRDNALQLDWTSVVNPNDLSYIVGNPPFVGAMVMNDAQREDVALIFAGAKGAGVLDYVAGWYLKAVEYISKGMNPARIRCAFVSTNSIAQGEQVGLLWRILFTFGTKIDFAHRTFRWTNEARGIAAVHCVIVGFGIGNVARKQLFEYESITGEPHAIPVQTINPNLVDGPDVLLENRNSPLCNVPAMRFGSMPRDGGHLILSGDERKELIAQEPASKKLIRPYTGAEEFINGGTRYCLWLLDVDPSELRNMNSVLERVKAVKKYRLASKAASTQKAASSPGTFVQLAQPKKRYLLVPRVSSERRAYVPMAFVSPTVIANDQVLTIEGAEPYHFGILTSEMHMAWMRATCGRLESRYRYSKDIVYNNFPWPEPTPKQRTAIESAAQAVLDERARHPGATLADLYDPLSMPPGLVKAHHALDRAVDAAYGKTAFKTEAERVAFLFTLYEKLTSLFPTEKKHPRKRRVPPMLASGT
jgi:hypothetical protein